MALPIKCASIFPALLCASAGTLAAEGIELSVYLENLRQEFIKLSSSPSKDQLPLQIGPVHVELSTIAKLEGGAGVKFYIVDTSGKMESEQTQKLSFDISLGKPGSPWIASFPQYPAERGMGYASGVPYGRSYGYGYGTPYGTPGWQESAPAEFPLQAPPAASK